MRARGAHVPTDDPVELERKRLALELDARSRGEGRSEVLVPAQGWSLPSKLALVLAAGLVAGYLLVWVQAVQESKGPEGYVRITDFVSTITGGLIIFEGRGTELYDPETQRVFQNIVLAPYTTLEQGKLLPYNHLPFEALVVAPFMNIPYPLIFALWTMIAGLAIGVSLGMMDSSIAVTRQVGWVMSMAACSYLPLIRSLMLGQNSPLVLMGLCGAYVAIKRNNNGWAGLALLLVALKPQVLPLVLLLVLAQGHWRALATFGLAFATLGIAAMPIIGFDWPARYAQMLVGVAGWSDPTAIAPGIMHNWRGFFTNLLGEGAPGLVGPLLVLASLLSVGLLVWAWRRSRPEAGEEPGPMDPRGTARWDMLWALTVVVAVLISPHLNPHDLSLLILPAWIAGAYAMSAVWHKWFSLALLGVLWAGYFLAPLAMYASNQGLYVIPSVLLMLACALLLAWQTTARRWREPRVQL